MGLALHLPLRFEDKASITAMDSLQVGQKVNLLATVYACWRIGAITVVADRGLGLNGLGAAVKKREDTHKMAEANKAFAHYRW